MFGNPLQPRDFLHERPKVEVLQASIFRCWSVCQGARGAVASRRHRHGPEAGRNTSPSPAAFSPAMSDEASPKMKSGRAPAGAISRELDHQQRGLHARASAKFVQMVERFNAEVWVTRGNETVGHLDHGLMMLAADRTRSWSPRSARGPGCGRCDRGTGRRQVQRRRHLSR